MIESNKKNNSSVTPREIVDASKGKNANGEPNCGFSVSEQNIDEVDRVKLLKDNVFTSPSIDFTFNGDFIILDVLFPSASSPELRVLWNTLVRYGKAQNENYGKDSASVLQFVIFPVKFSGEYYYTMLNPVFWALQPSMPGAAVDIIRLLFAKEALSIFKAAPVDEKEIKSEIEREEYENERLSEVEARRNAEHEEYLEKLNKRFNPNEC